MERRAVDQRLETGSDAEAAAWVDVSMRGTNDASRIDVDIEQDSDDAQRIDAWLDRQGDDDGLTLDGALLTRLLSQVGIALDVDLGDRPVRLDLDIDVDQRNRQDSVIDSRIAMTEEGGIGGLEARLDQLTDVEMRADLMIDIELDDDGAIAVEIDLDIEIDIEVEQRLELDVEDDGEEDGEEDGDASVGAFLDQRARVDMESDVNLKVRGVDSLDLDVGLAARAGIEQDGRIALGRDEDDEDGALALSALGDIDVDADLMLSIEISAAA